MMRFGWWAIVGNRRTFKTLGVLTACHLAATILLQVLTFASSMARFDSGLPADPIERGASAVVSVLFFPLLRPQLRHRSPAPWWYFHGVFGGYIPVALNSLLWAVAILGCVSLYRVSRRAACFSPGRLTK